MSSLVKHTASGVHAPPLATYARPPARAMRCDAGPHRAPGPDAHRDACMTCHRATEHANRPGLPRARPACLSGAAHPRACGGESLALSRASARRGRRRGTFSPLHAWGRCARDVRRRRRHYSDASQEKGGRGGRRLFSSLICSAPSTRSMYVAPVVIMIFPGHNDANDGRASPPPDRNVCAQGRPQRAPVDPPAVVARDHGTPCLPPTQTPAPAQGALGRVDDGPRDRRGGRPVRGRDVVRGRRRQGCRPSTLSYAKSAGVRSHCPTLTRALLARSGCAS